MTDTCFFERVIEFDTRREDQYSGTFIATRHTASPWSPAYQHAGPAAALMVRAAGQLALGPQRPLINQVAIDIMTPIPLGSVAVTARVIKPGRLTTLVEAELTVPGSEDPIIQMSAWCTRRTPIPVADRLGSYKAAPKEGADVMRPASWGEGFADAMEWRSVKGDMGNGRATVWARPKVTLVDDEPATGVQLAMLLADSASGVSALADPRELLFINTDLTVHLVREPLGEWLWMRAQSFIDPGGIGLSNSRIGDHKGSLGFGNQALFVAQRDEISI